MLCTFPRMTSPTPDSKLCNLIILWELTKTSQNFVRYFFYKIIRIIQKKTGFSFWPQGPFNSLHAIVPFSYPLKTRENQRFSVIFWWYRNGRLAWNGLENKNIRLSFVEFVKYFSCQSCFLYLKFFAFIFLEEDYSDVF